MRLNIGGGSTRIPGFETVDRKNGQEAYPLPHESDSVEEIRASHILEHFSFKESVDALREWARVLKPGGRLRLAVPDVEKVLAAVKDGDPAAVHYLMGGQIDSDDFHRSAWTREKLATYMESAGYVNVRPWESDGLDTSAHKVSLNLEGEKPEVATEDGEVLSVKIAAIMSIPRIGWNDSWLCITEALRPFGIGLRTFNGVFWGQCMQRVMLEAVEDGVDWILTIDYDSMFTKHHLDEMFRVFGQNPEIDALTPLQPKRGAGTPLCTAEGKTELEIKGDSIPITTGHFGLTLIRADALREMPLPWFMGTPGPDGKYEGSEKLDEDIYFWAKWRDAGKTLHLAPQVSIGHLELLCAQIQEDGTTAHMHVDKWREDNL